MNSFLVTNQFNMNKFRDSLKLFSSKRQLKETNDSEKNVVSDNLLIQKDLVSVQLAFTKHKPGEKEQIMTKESLTNMMKDDQAFDSFIKNEYRLNSTITVEGVKSGTENNPQIFVSSSIPVNVRRTTDGKKRNKQLHISGKLYKPELKKQIIETSNRKIEKPIVTEPSLTLRRVEVPLRELRSSLNGFTKRISSFEVVPWLTANYIINKSVTSAISSKTGIAASRTSTTKCDRQSMQNPSLDDQSMIAMPTKMEYKQNVANNSRKKSSPESYLSIKSIDDYRSSSKLKNENKKEKSSINERKSYFENLKAGIKSDILKIQNENQYDSLKSPEDSEQLFSKNVIKTTTKSPFKSELSIENSRKSSANVNRIESISSKNDSSPLMLNKPNSSEITKLNRMVNVANLTCDNSYCDSTVGRTSLLQNQSVSKVGNNKVSEEEIPVSSFTITRSRTHIIKYDDGTGTEKKIGRQTIRIEAPNGTLYTRKTNIQPIITNNYSNADNNNKRIENEQSNNSYENSAGSKPKIEEVNDTDDDNNNENNNKNNFSIYASQNIYELDNPQRKKTEGKFDFNEIIGDKYNPLTWLYSNYSKTKNLIKQFGHN